MAPTNDETGSMCLIRRSHDSTHYHHHHHHHQQQQQQQHPLHHSYTSIHNKPLLNNQKAKITLKFAFFFLATVLLLPVVVVAAKFEPYQLNGGLVSAVAGRNYVIIASDTRLTDGGYEILTRSHLESRLWSATTDLSMNGKEEEEVPLLDVGGSIMLPHSSSSSSSGGIKKTIPNICQHGTFVASAGCASDCEALKRIIRSEIHARASYSLHHPMGVSNVATLLGQTLYSRRSFPFYSFCVLAGMVQGAEEKSVEGAVYVYDAVGSFERVAVASSGVGKEMLQPVLDRFFVSSNTRHIQKRGKEEEKEGVYTFPKQDEMKRDGKALSPEQQRVGQTTLRPPVQTQVDCTAKEAVSMIVRAYRSVAEREIEVGDDLVLCVVQQCQEERTDEDGESVEDDGEGRRGTVQVMRFPLKKH